MKEMIKKIDRLLEAVTVKGESVLLLGDARVLLGQLYRMAGEQEEKTDG